MKIYLKSENMYENISHKQAHAAGNHSHADISGKKSCVI